MKYDKSKTVNEHIKYIYTILGAFDSRLTEQRRLIEFIREEVTRIQ